jgi:DNA-binding HxlR family transcriptional regulator
MGCVDRVPLVKQPSAQKRNAERPEKSVTRDCKIGVPQPRLVADKFLKDLAHIGKQRRILIQVSCARSPDQIQHLRRDLGRIHQHVIPVGRG